MAAAAMLYLTKPCSCTPNPKISFPSNSRVVNNSSCRFGTLKPKAELSHFLNIVEATSSYIQLPLQLELQEPSNALSLPTWAVHVSSVVEWIIAMALVWQYGEKSGHEAWKGLSWGMVPLLGGAFCACTWHFFYNSDSLEVLVALQAALTVIGNFTMCIAAYRIYKSSRESSENI